MIRRPTSQHFTHHVRGMSYALAATDTGSYMIFVK